MKNNATCVFTTARKIVTTAALSGTLATVAFWMTAAPASAQLLPPPPLTVSTIPVNGDVNPYGVAFVPKGIRPGILQPGDVLVSNFNNAENLQGTGTTIVRYNSHGQTSLFFQGQPPLGLTAALGIVRAGYVFVGSLPTTDGTPNTIQTGSLLILDNNGKLLGTISDPKLINGPWGMAIRDLGGAAQVFISNVLTGTILRFDIVFTEQGLVVERALEVASGFNHRTDPAALVLGPAGLLYDPENDTLFVAESADNAIYAIPRAAEASTSEGTGQVIYQDLQHLHGPLGLIMAPNGDLIVANSDGSNADPNQPSELVEFTRRGEFVTQFSIDPNNGGAFGLALVTSENLARFAAVNDNQVNLTIWTEPIH